MLVQTALHDLRRAGIKSGDSLTLPFLFCTWTILRPPFCTRRSYASDKVRSALTAKGSSNRHRQKLSPKSRSRVTLEVSQEYVKTTGQTGSDEAPKFVTRYERPKRHLRSDRGSPWRESYVPFEGLPSNTAPDPEFEGSTITPSERKAFESLLSIGSKGDEKNDISASLSLEDEALLDPNTEHDYEDRARALDTILETALSEAQDVRAPKLPPALQRAVTTAKDRFRAWISERDRMRLSQVKEVEQFEVALEAEKKKFRSRISSSNTDADIWDIFQETVVDVLERMIVPRRDDDKQLDGPTPGSGQGGLAHLVDGDSPHTSKSSLHTAVITLDTIRTINRQFTSTADADRTLPTLNTPQSTAMTPGQLRHDPATLCILLSAYTSIVQVYLAVHFRGSPLMLSVLPTIRNLGPAASAFVLTHDHYGRHLRELWRQYQDLPVMLDFLQLMDDEVILFNDNSIAAIEQAISFASKAQKGLFGPAVQVIWTMDAKQGYINEIGKWFDKIKAYRQEEELRRVKVEDAIKEGDIENERISFEAVDPEPETPSCEVFERPSLRRFAITADAGKLEDREALLGGKIRYSQPPDIPNTRQDPCSTQ